jgi:hypothetical protein
MDYRFLLVAVPLFFTVLFANAQKKLVLLSYPDNKTVAIKANDQVRLAFSSTKQKKGGDQESVIVGLHGRIDSIGNDKIWIKKGKKRSDLLEIPVSTITCMKKTSTAAFLTSIVGSYIVIGSAALLVSNQLDLSPAVGTYSSIAAIFPAVILSSNVFYPSKPKEKFIKLDIINE